MIYLKVQKAREIKNARIEFISLVDKAANKKRFIITKEESAKGKADFLMQGKILKANQETHHITGIVYEPMTEDAHGDFMTEDEIRKAAYWFAKNGDKIDHQHNFKPLSCTSVVETWIAKTNSEIEGIPVLKGSWLITIETENPDIWQAIQKGEITGFSMGGVGEYGKEEVSLNDASLEKESVIKKLTDWLGITKASPIQKEELDLNALELQNIVETATTAAVSKALSQYEANAKTATPPTHEADTAAIEKMVDTAVEKVFLQMKQPQSPQALTTESIQTMIDSAIQKALGQEGLAGQAITPTTPTTPTTDPITAETVETLLTKALEPILKARGLPSNISGEKAVEKSDEVHFLTGII